MQFHDKYDFLNKNNLFYEGQLLFPVNITKMTVIARKMKLIRFFDDFIFIEGYLSLISKVHTITGNKC